MKLNGKLVFWSSERNFGFVGVRTGTLIEKYFLHGSKIDLCVPEEPFETCVVKFDILPSLHPGRYPSAVHAEIYLPQPTGGRATLAGESEAEVSQ